jgi:hypothetical protein
LRPLFAEVDSAVSVAPTCVLSLLADEFRERIALRARLALSAAGYARGRCKE